MGGRWVIFLGLGLLFGGCANEDPEIIYRYRVSGDATRAAITYLDPDLGLVDIETNLPWQSEEFKGTHESIAELSAEALFQGAPPARIRCSIDRRSPEESTWRKGSQEPGPNEEPLCSIVLEPIGQNE